MVATTSARGTECYRAPELLRQPANKTKFEYNSKVDIWAVGCILYEVVLGRKAFTCHADIFEYCYRQNIQNRLFPLQSEFTLYRGARDTLRAEVQQMLEIEPSKQPRAREIRNRFQLLQSPQVSGTRLGSAARKKSVSFVAKSNPLHGMV